MGRPRKIRTEAEKAAMSKPKLTKEEKQERALKRQHEREDAKKDVVQDTDKFFCTNKNLLAEMIKWRDSAEKPEDRVISENLGKMILQIVTKLTNHSAFRNYSYDLKQEMISYGCFKIVQGLKNYNFKFNNVFAYITQAAWNANINVCIKYYKQLNLRRELIKNKLSQLECMGDFNTTKIINNYVKQYLGLNEDGTEYIAPEKEKTDED